MVSVLCKVHADSEQDNDNLPPSHYEAATDGAAAADAAVDAEAAAETATEVGLDAELNPGPEPEPERPAIPAVVPEQVELVRQADKPPVIAPADAIGMLAEQASHDKAPCRRQCKKIMCMHAALECASVTAAVCMLVGWHNGMRLPAVVLVIYVSRFQDRRSHSARLDGCVSGCSIDVAAQHACCFLLSFVMRHA